MQAELLQITDTHPDDAQPSPEKFRFEQYRTRKSRDNHLRGAGTHRALVAVRVENYPVACP